MAFGWEAEARKKIASPRKKTVKSRFETGLKVVYKVLVVG